MNKIKLRRTRYHSTYVVIHSGKTSQLLETLLRQTLCAGLGYGYIIGPIKTPAGEVRYYVGGERK